MDDFYYHVYYILVFSAEIAALLFVSKYSYNLLKDKIKNKYILGLASVAIADTAAGIVFRVLTDIYCLICYDYFSFSIGLLDVPILRRIYIFFVSNPLKNLYNLFLGLYYDFHDWIIPAIIATLMQTIVYIVFFAVIIMSFNPKTEKSKDRNKRQDKKQPSLSDLDEVMKYKQLLDANAISQEEFDTKKKQLLGQ